MGFGFMEVGGITPLPQPGNPKPRLFRIPHVRGLINRMGFPSHGMEVYARRIAAWRDSTAGSRPGILGIQIVKNKDAVEAVPDYIACVKKFASHADYLTVNVSSPNTPGLRDLQKQEVLTDLLKQIKKARDLEVKKPPIFVKISPDVTEGEAEDIAEAVLDANIDAVIVGNTSFARPNVIPSELAKEAGGFSGPPMFGPTTKLLANMYRLTQKKIPLIGNCGIFSGADAYAKIRAGASLVQIYTALIYEGPWLVPRIKRDLAALLKRDGFASVADAVGVDVH
jgi:dihydroorotate dehydrogenase